MLQNTGHAPFRLYKVVGLLCHLLQAPDHDDVDQIWGSYRTLQAIPKVQYDSDAFTLPAKSICKSGSYFDTRLASAGCDTACSVCGSIPWSSKGLAQLRTHIKIRWVALDADRQMVALYIDCQVFCPYACWNRNIEVDLGERLVPLVDHTTVVRKRMSLTWSKSFSTHRL